jgi:hypothetical protein
MTASKLRRSADPSLYANLPAPPGPSATFTIDVPVSEQEDATDGLAALLEAHEGYIDSVVPLESVVAGEPPQQQHHHHQQCPLAHASGAAPTLSWKTTPGGSASTPGSLPGGTIPGTRAMSSLGVRPLFNVDSATELLADFRRNMLPHFPAVQLSDADDVSALARERPFILLAILASASAGRAIGGRASLYDEEFRKVLGLKFVSSGERSLELLGGLLVYCAW